MIDNMLGSIMRDSMAKEMASLFRKTYAICSNDITKYTQSLKVDDITK